MEDCLNIGLCDDESEVHRSMERYLAKYAKERDISCRLACFSSGQELIAQEEKRKELDLLFLDIDMPGMDGIETAYRLNKQELPFKIIMLTGKTERFKEAFKIGAFRFVSKPVCEQELFEAIDDVRHRMLGRQGIRVFFNGKSHTVQQKEICYISAEKTSTIVYTKKYEYRSDLSLKQWEAILDTRLFFRCHKAYIVNFGAVEKVENEIVYLCTGEKILVSRRKRKDFEKKYMEYDTKYC